MSDRPIAAVSITNQLFHIKLDQHWPLVCVYAIGTVPLLTLSRKEIEIVLAFCRCFPPVRFNSIHWRQYRARDNWSSDFRAVLFWCRLLVQLETPELCYGSSAALSLIEPGCFEYNNVSFWYGSTYWYGVLCLDGMVFRDCRVHRFLCLVLENACRNSRNHRLKLSSTAGFP